LGNGRALRQGIVKVPAGGPEGKSAALTGSALILGGGHGARIGYDKKKLELGGASVLESLAVRLKTLFGEVLLSSNDPVEIHGVTVLPDRLGEGPLAGIYQGLLYCTSEYLYVLACDMPFINAAYIDYMRELIAREKMDVCIARHGDGKLEFFNSFYKKNCAAVMEEALSKGLYKLRLIFSQLNVYTIDGETIEKFDPGKMFFNINYKEDLELAEQKGRLKISLDMGTMGNHGRH
jgi:molybdopterin-guanine dinucleotide biosynthesis protein A